MATPLLTTFKKLSGGSTVPALRCGLVSRQWKPPRPVRSKARGEVKKVQSRPDLLAELLPVVKRVALNIRRHLPAHVELDELVANGVLGLVDALIKFDARKGVKLESYARHRIRGAILDALRSADPASRDLRQNNKRIQNLYHELEVKLGRPAHDEEIATASGMNLAQLQRALNEIQSAGLECGSRVISAGPTSLRQPTDPQLLIDGGDNPFDLSYRRQQHEILGQALSHLREREQDIITLRYRHGLTMKQIAARMHVDESRVSQIHSVALGRLKASVDSLLHRRHAEVSESRPLSMAAGAGA